MNNVFGTNKGSFDGEGTHSSYVTNRNVIYGLLGLFIVLGILVRFVAFQVPFTGDEASTYLEFISLPFWEIPFHYPVPNNHVFHNILASLSTDVFGDVVWAIRLPAFLAGLLLIVGGYVCLSDRHDVWWGMLTASLFSVMTYGVQFSVRARGYTIVGLATLSAFIFASRLLKRDRVGDHVGFILSIVLGAWTVPVMGFPALGLYFWLFLNRWLDGDGKYKNLLLNVGTTLAVLVGLYALPGYETVKTLSAPGIVKERGFLSWVTRLPSYSKELWMVWFENVSPVAQAVVALGMVLSMVPGSENKRGCTLLPCLLLGTLIPLSFLGSTPPARVLFGLWVMVPVLAVMGIRQINSFLKWRSVYVSLGLMIVLVPVFLMGISGFKVFEKDEPTLSNQKRLFKAIRHYRKIKPVYSLAYQGTLALPLGRKEILPPQMLKERGCESGCYLVMTGSADVRSRRVRYQLNRAGVSGREHTTVFENTIGVIMFMPRGEFKKTPVKRKKLF